ncbi:MAG: NYN domain-containing protein [Chloroflexota bacterium]|nr:NYN domain-containing protein [Chloroflexota bacterium]MDE2960321.1 NYN domain-containing protein [Chloroflexota bacterium]
MRVVTYIDGQNLYHLAREAWGTDGGILDAPYNWPSYDVAKLATALAGLSPDRTLAKVCFYTGVPDSGRWHQFWNSKLRRLRNQGIIVTRSAVSRHGREKGTDISLAIDLVTDTYEQEYDVAIIVSQDADFAPAVRRAKQVARKQGRFVTIQSSFPEVLGRQSAGIGGTTFIPINKALYDTCLEPGRYQPP